MLLDETTLQNFYIRVKKPKRGASTPIIAKTLYNSFEESFNDSSLNKTLDETAIPQNNCPIQNAAPKQKQKKTPDEKNNSKQKGHGWFSLNM